MSPAHVHIDGLVHGFGQRSVLDGIDVLAQGGVMSLLGANGAGKTTLLRCLATVLQPLDGTIRIDGLDPRREAERVEVRRRLGYLPQEVGFTRSATVFDTLDHIAVLKGRRDERRRRHDVFEALDRVRLTDRVADRVTSLSGGMRRRLGLAQAIIGDPTLLVLDEPAAGLDPDERQNVRSILAERRREQTTLVSTHLTDEAAGSDVVLVLHGGRIVFADTPERLAMVASGRVWIQAHPPGPDVRASWRRADGSHRCLGTPPPGASAVPPTIEDGYLLLVRS
ncbi:MAG: ATP-binding cassette domain-containing protein [Ilumatobacter sp.]|uniref:ABC transporter ATP-binding protein n=1 Tax=Ilumatobacter sp. TaxID=1967498 RepID=UPI003298AEDD